MEERVEILSPLSYNIIMNELDEYTGIEAQNDLDFINEELTVGEVMDKNLRSDIFKKIKDESKESK